MREPCFSTHANTSGGVPQANVKNCTNHITKSFLVPSMDVPMNCHGAGRSPLQPVRTGPPHVAVQRPRLIRRAPNPGGSGGAESPAEPGESALANSPVGTATSRLPTPPALHELHPVEGRSGTPALSEKRRTKRCRLQRRTGPRLRVFPPACMELLNSSVDSHRLIPPIRAAPATFAAAVICLTEQRSPLS